MRTIALVNQKGGVGKSTTAVNLGIGLTRQGKKGLLVDTHSQGNLTEMLGWKQIKGIFPKIEIFLNPIIGALQKKNAISRRNLLLLKTMEVQA